MVSCYGHLTERLACTVRNLTDRHERILLELGEEPTRVSDIARRLGLPPNGVVSAMYVLQSRGLAERVPFKGWVRR